MRVKRGIVRHRRHKKIRGLTKGYRGMRRTTFKKANEAMLRAGQNAYKDRRKKKSAFRALWIVRLNAAVRAQGLSYSKFVKDLKDKKIELNRKTLSEFAINEPEVFGKIVEAVR